MEFVEQEIPEVGDTVLVGMSGGVDSTVTALLLKKRGCTVIGVTMSLWDDNYPKFASAKEHCFDANESESIEECRQFCKEHDIEYHIVDLHEEYKTIVLDYFKTEYRAGRTPNPCIRCNALMKFSAMLSSIEKLGISYDYFCTGHYAKIVRPTAGLFGTNKKPYMLAQAKDIAKDQTYFIYRVLSSTLAKVRFPLANMSKKEVFKLAHEANLQAAKHLESQDFINPQHFDILFADKPYEEGDIVDLEGNILGKHKGIEHYTIGQRKGLGVSVSYPVYVHTIDATKKQIVLAPIEALQIQTFIADDFVWPDNVEPTDSFEASVKTRLASTVVSAIIERYIPKRHETFNGQAWKFTFVTPQKAIAPGQSVVIYDSGVVLGGGIIVETR